MAERLDLKALAAALRQTTPSYVRDLVGIAGVGLVVQGAYDIYRPAGLVVAGVLMIATALLWARGAR